MTTTDPQVTLRTHNVSMARSTYMYLMNEALARAHCTERLAQAEHERLVRQLLRGRTKNRPARRLGVMRRAWATARE